MAEFKSRTTLDTGINVFDAALERIRWIFDEFDNKVSVAISGGKDSTVTMELAAIVAKERGQKLSVHFLDQEAEWQHTRDYIRRMKDTRDDIVLDWYQVPFTLYNSTSFDDSWGQMWDPKLTDDQYVRPREPDSIHENDFGVTRFKDVLRWIHLRAGGAHLSGMRVEESPTRRLTLTAAPSYKWVTWSSSDEGVTRKEREKGANNFTLFHPIYDWSYRDIWTAIEANGWEYNPLYDEMFQYGVKTANMRVSSLIHTASVVSLPMVQELDGATWGSLIRRFPGVNTYGHVGRQIEEEYLKRHPHVFNSWHEYLAHLIDTLITSEENQARFWGIHDEAVRRLPWQDEDVIDRQVISQVFRNNHFKGSAFSRWMIAQEQSHFRKTTTNKKRSRA